MDFKKLEKKEEGNYIVRYDITYETLDHKEKVYEMISRNKDIKTFSELHDKNPDAVVLIIHNEDRDKILLNKEFRMAVGE